MTESDFERIRVIVTDAVAAAEKRLSEGQTRAVAELDRRIMDLEKCMIERQDAAMQRAADQKAELNGQIQTNLLASSHRQTARLHALEVIQNDVKIRLDALLKAHPEP